MNLGGILCVSAMIVMATRIDAQNQTKINDMEMEQLTLTDEWAIMMV